MEKVKSEKLVKIRFNQPTANKKITAELFASFERQAIKDLQQEIEAVGGKFGINLRSLPRKIQQLIDEEYNKGKDIMDYQSVPQIFHAGIVYKIPESEVAQYTDCKLEKSSSVGKSTYYDEAAVKEGRWARRNETIQLAEIVA
jgi:hypothetical protein